VAVETSCVVYTGGRDKRGGPVLQFPSESKVDDLSVDDLSTCLTYLTRLPRCVDALCSFTQVCCLMHRLRNQSLTINGLP